MACLPRDLVESELFGHARGAFTGAAQRKPGLFEEAGEGTLFLDEVAELPLEHQAKLLRALETRTYRPVGETRERPFRARLVAATHRRLADEVAAGRFREDLFYRLQVLPLELPPLRVRKDDILPIARHWLRRVAHDTLDFAPDAQQALLDHPWPGNVREVVNLVRRVALFAEDDTVPAALVRRMLAANPFTAASAAARPVPPEAVEEISLEAVERRHIEALLARHKNITHVARILEINRRTLQRKLKAWGLDHTDFGVG
ncbi:MAG: sigma-54-dependent Fis family transcriptional regulator [Myxococcales bacterium]|nr:sigma-54-dependent Fis family transcriptional regulator [Myxococcales bacterium]